MPEAFASRPELSINEEIAVDAWLACNRYRPIAGGGMGWISVETMVVWFDLHDIPKSNRSWYYAAMSAIDHGYMSQKAEQAEKD